MEHDCGGGKDREEPVDPVEPRAGMTVGELVGEMCGAGFGAGDVSDATETCAEMFGNDSTVFLSIAGAMVPAGMKEVFSTLIERGYVDVVVTTGANTVHDTVEALGGDHYHGSEEADDVDLHEEGIDRIYDVYLHDDEFQRLEDHVQEVLAGMGDGATIQEFTRALGEANDDGWLATAAENDVPVYCPAVQDSVVGLQAWLYTQTNDFTLDALGDMDDLVEICFDAESSGALIVGGGVPKNYTLQTMLVSPTTFDYAVQLTTDVPQTGGLSGATLDEARSWGKIGEADDAVTVWGDATITLPLVVSASLDRLADDEAPS